MNDRCAVPSRFLSPLLNGALRERCDTRTLTSARPFFRIRRHLDESSLSHAEAARRARQTCISHLKFHAGISRSRPLAAGERKSELIRSAVGKSRAFGARRILARRMEEDF